jgi:hypothetical protein
VIVKRRKIDPVHAAANINIELHVANTAWPRAARSEAKINTTARVATAAFGRFARGECGRPSLCFIQLDEPDLNNPGPRNNGARTLQSLERAMSAASPAC